jgi:hypothetical protein
LATPTHGPKEIVLSTRAHLNDLKNLKYFTFIDENKEDLGENS